VPRLALIAAFVLSFSQAALAQSNPRYLPLGPADAALYTPTLDRLRTSPCSSFTERPTTYDTRPAPNSPVGVSWSYA